MGKTINPAQGTVDELLARAPDTTISGKITVKPTGLTDDEVEAWVLVYDRNAKKFSSVWNGDYSGYPGDNGSPDASRAEFAMASKLGFYSGDPDQVERILRNSPMYRAKWDDHSSYLHERTIQRAMSGLTETFTPSGTTKDAESSTQGLGGWFDLEDVVRGTIKKIDQAVGWLVYMGHVHLVHSKPGAGKTLLAIWLAIQALKKNLNIMYFDAENGPQLMGSRFNAMGCTDFQNLRYNPSPEITLSPEQIAKFLFDVDSFEPDVIFFDSLADFLAMPGLNENDAGDVTRWFTEIIKPLRDRGIAVVILDHEPWESRGHARGSTAKFAKVDVEWELKKTKPFDQNTAGEITLSLKKDRPAQLEHKVLKFSVGGPKLKFEPSDGPAPDAGGVVLMVESVRHTTDAIKHFGEAGATDKEWKARTDELGTRSTKYYEAKRSLLDNERVINTEDGRFVWTDFIERTPLKQSGVNQETSSAGVSGVDQDQRGEFGSVKGETNFAGVITEITRSTVDTTPPRSGGSITPEERSNQPKRVKSEDPDDPAAEYDAAAEYDDLVEERREQLDQELDNRRYVEEF